ncbi:hypothetical protein D3C72_1014980 [compost metagenome]
MIGHGEAIGIAERTLQARVFARGQVLRCRAAQTVQPRAQALTVLPQLRCIRGRVVLLNLPTMFLLIEQGEGNAGDLKTLGQALQLLGQHLGQARQAAQAQLFGDLLRQHLALFAVARLQALKQQVADVQHLQQPGIGQGLHPAAQMQRGAVEAVEVQVQGLPLPVRRRAFDDEAAVGQQEVEQMRCLLAGGVLGQQVPQRTAQLNDTPLGIELHLQSETVHPRCLLRLRRGRRMAMEQAPEEFVPGTQNCRLALVVRVAGRFG